MVLIKWFILLLFSAIHCNNLDEDNYIPLEDESSHVHSCGEEVEDAYYRAAIVDYFPEQNRSLSPKHSLEKNVDNYIDVIRKISVNPIDIIVFPEDGLNYGIDKGSDFLAYTTVVTLNVTPCDSKRGAESFFVRLSCAAIESKVYLSVNLLERGQDDHNPNIWKIYNTNVVFDRKGTVIHRYRKFNMYGELGNNVSSKAEVSTFTTDFNVTFGVFICFDILNESPVSELLQLGVRHFIFPNHWFSELHFLTALQMQQIWSYRNDVVLLAAGTNYPKGASGGSGIYAGRSGPLLTHFSEAEATKVLYHTVPKKLGSSRKQKQNFDDRQHVSKDYPFLKLPYRDMDFTTLPLEYIINSTDFNNICDTAGFCCKFDVRISKNNDGVNSDQQYKYRVMVYSGLRSFTESTIPAKWIHVCAVIACTTNDLDSCGERYTSVAQSTRFESISITLTYDHEDLTREVYYPDSLTTEFVPMEADSFTWKENGTLTISLTKPRSDLFTFGIFGRNYAKDN